MLVRTYSLYEEIRLYCSINFLKGIRPPSSGVHTRIITEIISATSDY